MEDFLRKYVLKDLYQPHTFFTFDGPYTRLQMDDGSSFICILSSVWRARSRPFLCHVSYVPLDHMKPQDENEVQGFARDFYPEKMDVDRRKRDDREGTASFTLSANIPEESAFFRLDVDQGSQVYNHTFLHPETGRKLNMTIDISDNTPHSLLGPMWIARFLPVPLKWHIFSTRSKATVTISDGQTTLLRKDGLAHQEKNWGLGEFCLRKKGFPQAWIWCQGFNNESDKGSLAIAGGQVTSFLSAFMMAYRSPTSPRKWDFGPAWTMQLFGFAPFCQMTECSSETGKIKLTATNPLRGQRIVIDGEANPVTFQVMSAPLPQGHTPWYCHESFQTRYRIRLFEKRWFRDWQKVEDVELKNATLEFGGEWSHWWTNLSKERQEGLKHGKYE